MQRLEVSGAVRPIYGSLGVKRLRNPPKAAIFMSYMDLIFFFTDKFFEKETI